MTETSKIKKVKASGPQDMKKSKPDKKTPKQSVDVAIKKRKATEDAASAKVKKTRVPTAKESTIKPEVSKEDPSRKSAKEIVKKSKPGKNPKSKSKEEVVPVQSNVEGNSESSSEESETDEHSEPLLKGFQSDEDENNAIVKAENVSSQQKSPQKELSQTIAQISKQNSEAVSENPAVLYIGRIPHGFYENEMKSYFSQFGNILKIRLSRNKKTGASKHRAWIQFESASVAEIVAKTMDNYLMFGHILKVKLVPEDQIPKDLFKGANKRFKKVPWNKMEGRKLQQPLSREAWQKRIEREEKRRAEKAAKLKALGYEFESPDLCLPGNNSGLADSPPNVAEREENVPSKAPDMPEKEKKVKKTKSQDLVTVQTKAKSKYSKKEKKREKTA